MSRTPEEARPAPNQPDFGWPLRPPVPRDFGAPCRLPVAPGQLRPSHLEACASPGRQAVPSGPFVSGQGPTACNSILKSTPPSSPPGPAPSTRGTAPFSLSPFPLDTTENMGYKIGLSARGKVGSIVKLLISKGKERFGVFCSPWCFHQSNLQNLSREVSFIQSSGGVAQLVRACGSYPQCPEFESLHRHQCQRSPLRNPERVSCFGGLDWRP